MNPVDFIMQVGAAAQASAKLTGIPASFAVADAALESGWGNSQLARQAMNLFGVKADPSWHGDVLTMNTREYLNGYWIIVPARWRKYPGWLECLADHAAFLIGNPRYAACFAQPLSGADFARAVAAAGYATDPAYADKVIAVMNGRQLASLDLPKDTA